MRKIFYLFALVITVSTGELFAQGVLPDFSVKEIKGKIIVSWLNKYPFEVKSISIQRSYDSTKSFSTLSTVLNPQNIENGYVDKTPPYNKMFYRLFIAFDAGEYIFCESKRPVIDSLPVDIESSSEAVKKERITKKIGRNLKPISPAESVEQDQSSQKSRSDSNIIKKEIPVIPKEESFPFPSKRIYTGKDNNIVISLQDITTKKYAVKFFDDKEKFLFELNNITDEYLIIEKVNFLRAGWFQFHLYENGKMLEKNKFFIAKDGKNQ